jgi:hypothetical protein
VRFVISTAVAAVLLVPTGLAADPGRAPSLRAHSDGSTDVSSARKKRIASSARPAKKEQYLRAVPSAPPPGGKGAM